MATTDKEQVEQKVNDYIRATFEGDGELLKNVFHPQAQMAGFLGEKKMYGSAEPFIADIGANPSVKSTGAAYEASITNIEVCGDTASATLEEKGLMGMNFTNFFHLLREDNTWFIISKTFSGSPL